MSQKEETDITQSILDYIKKVQLGDGYHVHGSSVQRGGEPDITGEVPTSIGWVHLKIEVKTQDGVLDERQKYRLRKYWERGYLVGVVSSRREFIDLLYAYMAWRVGGIYPLPELIRVPYPEIYEGRHNYA